VTPELIAAAVHLADTLAHENHALAALDLPRAAGLLDEKTRAMDGFGAAQAMLERGARSVPASDQGREAEQLAGRLRDLALENRRLLEHAIAVQGRVIGLVAHAVRRTVPQNGGSYGADGGRTGPKRQEAIALSARA
jgi:hypothetical protein